MRPVISVIAATAAGCASTPSPDPLPSADLEPRVPRPPSASAAGSARPCRYDHSFFYAMFGSNGLLVVPGHDQARVTYNPAGLDVLEEAVDDADHFAFRRTFAYDAMGNLVHDTTASAESAVQLTQDWLVYDSFGRLIRHSMDRDGDGREDWIAAYGYAGDGNPVTAHVVSTQGAGEAYDRAYHYDDNARLIEVDRSRPPDGTIDQINRYDYDDVHRVTLLTTSDGGGGVVGRSVTTYDDRDRVVSVESTELDAQGNVTATATDRFTYDADRLISEAYDNTAVAGSAVRYDWHYDHCQ
jgi:hypothetical protein